MRYLITGGCGFVGSNVALKVLDKNEELIVADNLSRIGSTNNLEWLKSKGKLKFYNIDVRNAFDVEKLIKETKPDVIFHLAGQVAMTTSIENPRLDFQTNVVGTFNVLDSIVKYSPDTIIIYSSSNKVYGDLEYLDYKETHTRYICLEYPNGFNENLRLDFHSPYGCSKGAADQYLLDFSRIYNIRSIVFRHSTMFGGRQFSNFDQGWIGWFISVALSIKYGRQKEKFTINGNGKQVRDVLYTDDIVNLYFKAVENIKSAKGNAFNIGGGVKNSLSLLELFSILEGMLDIEMNYIELDPRESDQKVFIADNNKANEVIGWEPKIEKELGIKKMVEWMDSTYE